MSFGTISTYEETKNFFEMGVLWLASCVVVLHMIIYCGHFHIIEGSGVSDGGENLVEDCFKDMIPSVSWHERQLVYVCLWTWYDNFYINLNNCTSDTDEHVCGLQKCSQHFILATGYKAARKN